MDKIRNKVVRPSIYDEESGSENEYTYNKPEESDDELATISFGSLSSAQKKLQDEERTKKNEKREKKAELKNSRAIQKKSKPSKYEQHPTSDSESEGFFDDEAPRASSSARPGRSNRDKGKKNKHAPSESSSKRPVSKVREIEGLGTKYKDNSLYRDIRFDAAYGKADLAQIRKNYAFLDGYREQEISQMKLMLKDKKASSLLSHHEREDIEFRVQSLKSRLDTMKNRDLESKILADHKHEQLRKFKDGSQTNPYFLKKSDKRKLIQKAKFDTMKSSQREKVMERKRKRRLGKEFRELEFNQHRK